MDGQVVITFINLRGILLVEHFSSADIWQYPPPCMNTPMTGMSPMASRLMSGEWVEELEPRNKVSYGKSPLKCMRYRRGEVTYFDWGSSR